MIYKVFFACVAVQELLVNMENACYNPPSRKEVPHASGVSKPKGGDLTQELLQEFSNLVGSGKRNHKRKEESNGRHYQGSRSQTK
jgi:hypothetical protein